MNLTDLIPPDKLFEWSHSKSKPDKKEMEERSKRINEYTPAIQKCIMNCGSFPGIDVDSEINLTLGILLTLDIALSKIPKQ